MCLQLPFHYFERKAKDKINQNLLDLTMGLEERGEKKRNFGSCNPTCVYD
jgi:hypothetical protein